jgi:hypothetical protein
MNERSNKRALVWSKMEALENCGLGTRQFVSDDRDKFMLNPDHRSAYRLSSRPDANGFIRADSRSLLFRDATDELRRMLTQPHDMSFASAKGVEFRWADIDEASIHRFFEHVARLAG